MYKLNYLTAKLQAKLSSLASDRDWYLLDGLEDVSSYMQGIKQGSLHNYFIHFSDNLSGHEVEQLIRERWHAEINNLTLPKKYQAALEWIRFLFYLDFIDYKLNNEPLAWMEKDSFLNNINNFDLFDNKENNNAIWLEHWQKLWPNDTSKAKKLGQLLLSIYTSDLTQLEALKNHYKTLREKLISYFHHNILHALTIFAYLGLIALDLYKLRAEVLQRALFSQKEIVL